MKNKLSRAYSEDEFALPPASQKEIDPRNHEIIVYNDILSSHNSICMP